MINYYRRCLPHASDLQIKLLSLVCNQKSNTLINWTEEARTAFQACKDNLSTITMLAHPSSNAQLAIFADSSSSTVGASLQQLVDGIWEPLGFFSKKMTTAQAKWPIFYKELFAVFSAIKHFRHFVEAQQVIIYTDHKPLTFIFQQKTDTLPPVQCNQVTFISQFTTDIRHISGKDNVVADAFSRISVNAISNLHITLHKLQQEDQELQLILQDKFSTSLNLQLIDVPDTTCKLYCDVSTTQVRPFVPLPLRRLIFNEIHNLNHPGTNATISMISSRYIWPNMRRDCRRWTRTCQHCQQNKVTRFARPSLGNFPPCHERFAQVHIDLVSSFPNIDGFAHCLTMIDRFTRWPEAIPIKSLAVNEIIQSIQHNRISRFGVPRIIISDRGAQFTSYQFMSFEQDFGIEHRFTTAYHPQANGMIERLHRVLRASLKCVHHDQNWFTRLPLVLLGMRNAFKPDINATCSELVYGTSLRLPSQIFTSDCFNDPAFDVSKFKNKMSRLRLPPSRHFIENIFKIPQLDKCTHIFLKEGTTSAKYKPTYSGPHPVIMRNDKIFKILLNGKETTVSISRIKPAFLDFGILEDTMSKQKCVSFCNMQS